MPQKEMEELSRRMDGALEALRREFAGLRTGRASAHLLEPIVVHAYGSDMPITQVGTISVPEPRMITVQVWDRSVVSAVELSQERRQELTKVAHKSAEQGRVAVRNVRRDGMEQLKKMEKDGKISQDEHRGWSEKVQKLTDDHIKKIDETLAQKEKEILQV